MPLLWRRTWHPEIHRERAAEWTRKRLVKGVHGTHGLCDDKGYSLRRRQKKLPPNSKELKKSYDIFNGGGEQHSSWFDTQLHGIREACEDTKKSTIAKRVGQITPMCDPKTTRAYCCTKPNWISRFDNCRLWNNRPRPHSLGLLANIFAARKKFAGRYFREKIFSREDIFAGSYFRGKIFSREDIFAWTVYSRKYFKFTFRENFLPRK